MEQNKILYPRPGIEYHTHGSHLLLIRCPECGKENYALNVITGICTWCGYDAKTDPKVTNHIQQHTNGKERMQTTR